MSLKHLRTVWIATFTLIALTLSSVASSAPLMSLKMLSMAHNTTMNTDGHCAEMSSHGMHNPAMEDKHCDQKMADIDTCCSMACISFSAYIPSHNTHLSRVSQLAKIPQDTYTQKSTYPRSLYRPPIA
ncbi:hypothetical protein [Photobacterium leiognathi]|uniref:hypothetical protein n=1 Tax=Photobacterium leiognathi TaxID=553611 RepID=UPI002734E1B5|nr:hypothetical protein [Photobacterium leiognathi]